MELTCQGTYCLHNRCVDILMILLASCKRTHLTLTGLEIPVMAVKPVCLNRKFGESVIA